MSNLESKKASQGKANFGRIFSNQPSKNSSPQPETLNSDVRVIDQEFFNKVLPKTKQGSSSRATTHFDLPIEDDSGNTIFDNLANSHVLNQEPAPHLDFSEYTNLNTNPKNSEDFVADNRSSQYSSGASQDSASSQPETKPEKSKSKRKKRENKPVSFDLPENIEFLINAEEEEAPNHSEQYFNIPNLGTNEVSEAPEIAKTPKSKARRATNFNLNQNQFGYQLNRPSKRQQKQDTEVKSDLDLGSGLTQGMSLQDFQKASDLNFNQQEKYIGDPNNSEVGFNPALVTPLVSHSQSSPDDDISLDEIANAYNSNVSAGDPFTNTLVNEKAIKQSYRDERIARFKFKNAFKKSPKLFVFRHVVSFYSLINPILSILLGTTLSLYNKEENTSIQVLVAMIITTILIQLFANLCKEYSNEDLGSKYECRLVDNDLISRNQIYRYARLALFSAAIAGATLIYFADLRLGTTLVFAGLGIMICTMLLRYSVGDNPYNFSIIGEFAYLFVYGLLMVTTSFFLQVHEFSTSILYPALACGMCCVASLNLINMRDSYVTITYHKENFATYLGHKAARVLQTLLYLLALVLYTYFNFTKNTPWWCYMFFISLPVILYHLWVIHHDVKTVVLHRQKYVTQFINLLITGTFTVTTFLSLNGIVQ